MMTATKTYLVDIVEHANAVVVSEADLTAYIQEARSAGFSLGACTEIIAECPNCEQAITEANEYIPEHFSGGGVCLECYDGTPSGVEYSHGFEMNH